MKRIRLYKPILKKSVQRRQQRARNKVKYLKYYDLPTAEPFTLFQTAKILNTENNLRQHTYTKSLKFLKYLGTISAAIEVDYQIASHALFLNSFDPEMAEKYFECCGSYHNFLKDNIHHCFVKKKTKNLMASESLYSNEYKNLHFRVKELPEVIDAYLLSCKKNKLYKLMKKIECLIKYIEYEKRIQKIEPN